MTQYSDQDLEAMLSDLESDLTERKQSFSGDVPRDAREAVCAFANDLPNYRRAGVLFIGVKDNGNPASLVITDELLRQLADIKTDGNIVPPPTLAVAKHVLRGTQIAVITVEPADSPPVRYKGRIHIRIGPRRGIASAQDERVLNEKRRFRDLPFDTQPVPSATTKDLNDRLFLEEYLPSAFAADVLAANERSLEQQLAVCKMVASADEPIPTIVGLLVLGIRVRDFIPGAYVQFLRINGVNWSDDVVDEEVIDGPISQIIPQLDSKLTAHNRVAVDLTSGTTERRSSTYPIVALQQVTRNALMHRTYESTNAPVRVYWYNDRIEITSPGGPFGTVTPENFGAPGITDYRNPNVAEALRVFQLTRSELAKSGNPPPEFEVTPTAVVCRIAARL
jgi:ATP-dependent DNA helicase RecG